MGEVGAMLTGTTHLRPRRRLGRPAPVRRARVRRDSQMPEGWPRSDSTVHFVTDGLESAVGQAKAAAGDKIVGMHGPDTIRQCLDAGLLDEIRVDLVPLLLGSGIPLFDRIGNAPVTLGNPTVVEGVGVTHLQLPGPQGVGVTPGRFLGPHHGPNRGIPG